MLFIANGTGDRPSSRGRVPPSTSSKSSSEGTRSRLKLLCGAATIVVDRDGSLLIADAYARRVRRVDGTTGIITTIAGTGGLGFGGDGGPATAADLYAPSGLALDPLGNLFVADGGSYRVRSVGGSCSGFLAGTRLAVSGSAAPPRGFTRLAFSGRFAPPTALFFAALDPLARGASVTILDGAGGVVAELPIPAGRFSGSGSRGWKSLSSGRAWQFLDRTGPRASGIVRMTPRQWPGGLVAVQISGRNGSAALDATAGPLQIMVGWRGSAGDLMGYCATTEFAAGECRTEDKARRIHCMERS